jgi:protein SCO1/2
MTQQSSRIALVLASFLAGLAVFLVAIWFVVGPGPSATGSAIGGSFELTDQNGKPISDKDFAGKPFLVFFGYTHCPDVCPTTLFDVSEMLRALGKDADRTAALFITVDPQRDTPTVLKDYLSNFDPHLHGATGSADSIAAVEKTYRVYAKKVPTGEGEYSMDHSAVVYLMDKQGRFVAPFSLKRSPAEAAADLRRYL